MHTILVVVQVLVAVSLIGLILVQHGKGADAGAAFGSGASGTVFGARGAANFLTRLTAILATAFFIASLTLAYLVSDRSPKSTSVIDTMGGSSMVTDEVEEPVVDESTSSEATEVAPPAQDSAAQAPQGEAEAAGAESPEASSPKVPE